MQRAPGTHLRMPIRPDGRTLDADLISLSDRLAERENEFQADIELKVQNHRKWNQNHIDLTRDPLSPVKEQGMELKFRPAKTQYLMTPPASASSDDMDLDQDAPESPKEPRREVIPFQFNSGTAMTTAGQTPASQPSFRRRIGRLNRLWIDRRGLGTARNPSSEGYSDRWKYDSDSSDDEPEVYEVDQYDTRALKFRATIPLNNIMHRPRVPVAPDAANSAQQGSRSLPAPPAPQPQPAG